MRQAPAVSVPSPLCRTTRLRGLLIALLLAAGALLAPQPGRAASTFVVNNTGDAADEVPGDGDCSTFTGVCTLRAAIEEANALAGLDVINFNIPGGGVQTIVPASDLPTITDSVVIDGYSQPGATPNSLAAGTNAALLIELDGSNTTVGLRLYASDSTIRGLVVNRAAAEGIQLGRANNVIAGNFIGVNPAGTAILSNGGDGILSGNYASPPANANNRIGGPAPADRNLISGNGRNGITLDQVASNTVQNNYFGTDVTGNTALANAQAGVGVYIGASHTIVGNVISGNLGGGIESSESSAGLVIQDNLVGVRADLSAPLQNGTYGIFVNNLNPGTTGAKLTGNTVTNNGGDGIFLTGLGQGQVTGNKIQGNTGAGILLRDGGAVSFSTNSISGNGKPGIDLGGDGLTFNHQGAVAGPNGYQNYPLINVAAAGAASLRVAGTLPAPDGTYRIEFFANTACDDSGFGEGETYLGFVNATASGGSASFDTTLTATASEGQGLSATATDMATGATSEFSYCRPISNNNTNWANATAVALAPSNGELAGSASQRILEAYQEKWFKFAVQPGDKVRVTLQSPAGSAITLHRNPLPFYNQLISPSNVAVLSADSADLAFLPSGALPPGALPSGSLPGGTLPSGSLPPGALPGGFFPGGTLPSGALPPGALPSGSLPPGSLPGGALPPGSLPSGALPPGTLPSGALPPGALPSGSLPPGALPSGALPPGSLPSGALPPGALAEPYSGAARRSLMAAALDPNATTQVIERNTYDLQEDLYIRVVGPYYPSGAFSVSVEVVQGVCGGVQAVPAGTAAIAGAQPGSAGLKTLILTDSSRLPGTSAEVSSALSKLAELAGRSDVRGVVVDLADTAKYPGVAFANGQADANPACPSAKNTVASEIKRVIDAYRAANVDVGGKGTVEYIVLAGSRGVIPFYQSADVAGMANEREYNPPVAAGTASEAGLKTGRVQGQDFYGASVSLDRGGRQFFVPDLAVGRLVETANDIVTTVDRFIKANGQVTPSSALVTGYDFVGDTAQAVSDEVTTGLNPANCATTNSCKTVDTLIQPQGLPPSDPSAWTAGQLRTKLIQRPAAGSPSAAAGKNDLIVMSGHFSAGSLVAADYSTRMAATEIMTATAYYTDSVVLALGCHGGFTIPGGDLIQDTSPDPDWAKAFLRRSAAGFIASSGYAYGSTTTVEWGERVFVDLSRQLRAGDDPVALGKALVAAKKAYLAKWADQLDGYDEKTLAEMNLYGLPMMKINMPGQRLPADADPTVVAAPVPVTSGPGAGLNLYKGRPVSGNGPESLSLSTEVTPTSALLQDLSNPANNVTTTWAYGKDGVVVNPFEPLQPRARYNVNAPGYILRGVAFRGGTYTDMPDIIPFTEAPTTETSRAHEAFYSNAFYPAQVWLPNFLDAVSGGPERLIAVPGQYKSAAPGSIRGTLRTFNALKFNLYYLPSNWADANSPANVKAAAVASAPTIHGASASESGGVVIFNVNVLSDGSAGVQGVTVLYTAAAGPLYGQWQPLDLARPDPNADPQGALDPTLWTGQLTLPSGQDGGQVQFIVQAINGAGLTTLATNNGAYYTVRPPAPPTPPPPPVAAALVFQNPPASGVYLQSASFTVQLTADGQPLAGRLVQVSLAGQGAFATTDPNGAATVTIKPVSGPGEYSVQASFAGDGPSDDQGGYTAASASAPFTLSKDNTSLTLTLPSGSPYAGVDSGVKAALRDSAGQALGGKTVVFVLTGNGRSFSRAVAADVYGSASLGSISLPAGTYSVKAYFSGAIDLGNGQTITWPDDDYNPSQASGSLTLQPLTVDAGPDALVYEGDTFALAPATFGAGAALQSATIDWGDGQTSAGTVAAGTVSGSHAYTRPGSYRITVSVTDAVGNAASDFLTLKVLNGFFRGCAYANDRTDIFTLDGSSRVSCNISGYGPIQLAGYSQVNASVTSIGSSINLGDSGRVDVDLLAAGKIDTGKSSTVGRNLTSGGNVTIGDSGRVTGNVRASGSVSLGKNTSIGGTITRNAAPPVIPGVTPAAFSFTSGSQAVTVANSATRTLAPGKYGVLSLGSSATLNLSAGTYTFDSISTGNSSRIALNLANGNVVINVVKTLTFGSSTQVTVSGGAARNVLWQVQGGPVTLGKTSKSVGTFLAPNASIDLYDSGMVTGALYGSKVHLQKTTVVTGDPAQALYVSLYLP